MFMLLPILLFLPCVFSGRILPYSANFITISTTNANDVAEYNFTMLTDNPIPPSGTLDIEFPTGQFMTGLGLPNAVLVYAPYPNLITATINDRTVTCNIGAQAAGTPFTVTVEDVINPLKVGGTGNFQLTSKINSYVIDESYVFGVVGISSSADEFISATIAIESGQSAYAGQITNYIVSFETSDNIQANVIIRVIFPVIYNLNYVIYDQCAAISNNGYQLSGSLTCQVNQNFQNMLDVLGNAAIIPKGQLVQIRISEIYNPSVAMTTDLFTFRLLDKGSNNTLQIADSVPGLVIQAGVMAGVSLTGYYPDYLPFVSYTRSYQLAFKPTNPFNAIRISTSFSLITSCNVDKGLLDLTLTSNVNCVPQSNIMLITNFQQYVYSDFSDDYIEVMFQAVLPSTVFTTNPIQTYTYLDLAYLTMVDADIASVSTTVTLLAAPTIAASATIALSPVTTNPNAAVVFVVTFQTGISNLAPNMVNIEIPSNYIGTPICQCNK